MRYWDATKQEWFDDDIKSINATTRTEAAEAKFKLIIPRSVMDKIEWWMRKTDKEISGFGSLEFLEEQNTFRVKDAIILKQKVTATSAEIDPNAMAKAMFQMKDDPYSLKWHWHSHVNMGVFWSGDDMEIIRSLGQRGWILASVFNYKREVRTAYLTQVEVAAAKTDPIKHDVFIDNVDTQIINYVPQEQYEAWDKEYDTNVETYTWKSQTNTKTLTTTVRPFIHNYDDYGYGVLSSDPTTKIYNPVFDKDLKTNDDKMSMIADLNPEEIMILCEYSPSFNELYNKFKDKEDLELSELKANQGEFFFEGGAQ